MDFEPDLHHDGSEVDNREVGDLGPAVDVNDIGASLFLSPRRDLSLLRVLNDDCRRRGRHVNQFDQGMSLEPRPYLVHSESTSRPCEDSGVRANIR